MPRQLGGGSISAENSQANADGIGAAHSDAEVAELLQALDIYAIFCMAGFLDLAGLSTVPCSLKMKELTSELRGLKSA
jgi:hypothetical protein